MTKKIRVIIADDSAFMRKQLSEILNSDPNIEVIATANNGQEALHAVYVLRPDVVTLDVEMPFLNGLDTLGYIMSECPVPCVMISAYTQQGGQQTLKALEFGAIDFVTKPGGQPTVGDLSSVATEIIEKIKVAAAVPVKKLKLLWTEKVLVPAPQKKALVPYKKVFVIGSSTGGTQALATLLPKLPADFPAAVLVAQHMPKGFTKNLAHRLNDQSQIEVVEAQEGMPLEAGKVIVAQGGIDMEVGGSVDDARVILTDKHNKVLVKPSADVLFGCAAHLFKDKCVGVILTGMGSDGTLGAQAIREQGGVVLAQDEASSIVYGMPRSAFDAGVVNEVVGLDDMAQAMERVL